MPVTIVTEPYITVTVSENDGRETTVMTTAGVGFARAVGFTPYKYLTSTNLQGALEELVDNYWQQDTAPSAGTAGLDEGDLWYDTTNNRIMVYRDSTLVTTTGTSGTSPITSTSGTAGWEELILANQIGEGTTAGVVGEYGDLILDGGFW